MPIFSVVMPVFNVEKYLKHSVQSVLEQTFNDFELIIVNDGSTDSSKKCLEQIIDTRVTIIEQENRGLAGARNTGIRAAKGKYVAFIDSDDLWHPDKLKYHFEHLQINDQVGVSYSQSALIDDNGHSLGIVQSPKINNVTFRDIICRNPIGNGSAPVVRREVLDETVFWIYRNGIKFNSYFDESFRQSEDIEYWLRIAATSQYKFEGIAQPLTFYRINNTGLSANLEQQLYYWEKAISKASLYAPEATTLWCNRAKAFQLRYLARRAIRSGSRKAAIKMLRSSFKADNGIILEEPAKSITTFISVLILHLLPVRVFTALANSGLSFLRLFKADYKILNKYKLAP